MNYALPSISYIVVCLIFATFLPNINIAQTTKEGSQADKKEILEFNPKIQKWGEATLIIKDDKGNVLLNSTEKYPIIDPITKTEDFNNCWDFCRRVCDGYGVCWVSCGWHCSPWTR